MRGWYLCRDDCCSDARIGAAARQANTTNTVESDDTRLLFVDISHKRRPLVRLKLTKNCFFCSCLRILAVSRNTIKAIIITAKSIDQFLERGVV